MGYHYNKYIGLLGDTVTQKTPRGLLDRALGRHKDQCCLPKLRHKPLAQHTNMESNLKARKSRNPLVIPICYSSRNHKWCSVARPLPLPPPKVNPPLTPGPHHASPGPPRGVGRGVVYVGCLTPPRPPVSWWWVWGNLPPPPSSSPCGVVWCGGGLWVSSLVFNPLPPFCGVVVGVGFRV